MANQRCPRCGYETDATFAFCHACGEALRPAPERTCGGCGAKLDAAFRFCGHCGRPAASLAAPAPRGPEPRLEEAAASPPASAPAMPAPGEVRLGDTQARAAAGDGRGLRLVAVRHDGEAGAVQPLGSTPVMCGRGRGQVRFDDDPTVDVEHARFTVRNDAGVVEDLGSVNGTFLRLRAPQPLARGDEIRLGRQLLRLEPVPRALDAPDVARPWGSADPGYRARLTQLLEGGGTGEVFPLRAGENTIGRELADVSFPGDRYVSARHARLDVRDDGSIVIADVGSSNGTFIRITSAERLAAGDQVLIGMHLVRIE